MNLSLAFGVMSVVIGIALFPVAIEYSTWVHPEYHKGHRNWMIGLFIACVLFAGLAVLFGSFGQNCNEYSQSDYQFKRVPVKCVGTVESSKLREETSNGRTTS